MKRAHRRWHRRIGGPLLLVIAGTLTLLGFTRELPPDNAVVPPALSQAAAGGSR